MKNTPAIVLFVALAGLGMAAWTYYNDRSRQTAALDSIAAIEARLAFNNSQQSKANASTVRQIGRIVAQNRYQPRDVVVLQQCQQIVQRSDSLAGVLHQWQQNLRAQAGEAGNGALRHPGAPTALPAARTALLAQGLNKYSVFIRAFIPWAAPLAPKESPRPGTTWLYSDGAPLAAALSSLTQLEAQARRLAREALSKQAQKVGTNCICFDKIGAMAVAATNTVAPGAVYEARLFMTQSASGLNPKMSVDGRPIAVGYDGQGTVEFRVPPLRPNQPDSVRAHWRGRITTRSYLADTTYQLDVPYSIVKPRTR